MHFNYFACSSDIQAAEIQSGGGGKGGKRGRGQQAHLKNASHQAKVH